MSGCQRKTDIFVILPTVGKTDNFITIATVISFGIKISNSGRKRPDGIAQADIIRLPFPICVVQVRLIQRISGTGSFGFAIRGSKRPPFAVDTDSCGVFFVIFIKISKTERCFQLIAENIPRTVRTENIGTFVLIRRVFGDKPGLAVGFRHKGRTQLHPLPFRRYIADFRGSAVGVDIG